MPTERATYFMLDLASGIRLPVMRAGMANIYLVAMGALVLAMWRSVATGRIDAVGAAMIWGWMVPIVVYEYARAVCRVRLSESEIEVVTPVRVHRWPLEDLAVIEMRERRLVVGRYLVVRRRSNRIGRAFFVGGLGIDFDALTVQFNEAAAMAMERVLDPPTRSQFRRRS